MAEVERIEFQSGQRWVAIAAFEGRIGVAQWASTKEEAIRKRERDIDSRAYLHTLSYVKALLG